MTVPEFHALDFQHIVALAVIAAGCVLMAWIGRSEPTRKWLGRLLALSLMCYGVVLYALLARDDALSWEYSLPLELCNLVLIACIVSLLRPNRFTTEIAYFWGFGGVLQATLTPELSVGFPSWDFIFFFWGHGVTLMAIIFLVSDRGYAPRRGSVVRMMAALNVYGLLVGSLDWAAGWNYGFLCRKPSEPSLFDVLGPWPWYLLSLEAIALVTFSLLNLPWQLRGWLEKRSRAAARNHS